MDIRKSKEKIEELREKLHIVIDKGNPEQMLELSCKLDMELLKYMKETQRLNP